MGSSNTQVKFKKKRMSGIAVTLELKGKNVFLAGERVQGTWFVNVNSEVPVKVNFITTYLIGATYVE